MDTREDTTADTIGENKNEKFPDKSRLLRDERGQMVQLPQIWQMVQTDFQLVEICGEGSFGRVVKARHRTSNKEVAIK